MKQRRFEIFIALVLAAISYFGNYYLKEPLVKDGAGRSMTWYVLDVLWLLAMVVIGYWGLIDHEFSWVKGIWLIVNSVLLILLFANKLTQYLWQHFFIPDGAGALIRSPFFFLTAAFLPRWFMRYKAPKGP